MDREDHHRQGRLRRRPRLGDRQSGRSQYRSPGTRHLVQRHRYRQRHHLVSLSPTGHHPPLRPPTLRHHKTPTFRSIRRMHLHDLLSPHLKALSVQARTCRPRAARQQHPSQLVAPQLHQQTSRLSMEVPRRISPLSGSSPLAQECIPIRRRTVNLIRVTRLTPPGRRPYRPLRPRPAPASSRPFLRRNDNSRIQPQVKIPPISPVPPR